MNDYFDYELDEDFFDTSEDLLEERAVLEVKKANKQFAWIEDLIDREGE